MQSSRGSELGSDITQEVMYDKQLQKYGMAIGPDVIHGEILKIFSDENTFITNPFSLATVDFQFNTQKDKIIDI